MRTTGPNLSPNQRVAEYASRVVAQRVERLAFLVEKASRGASEGTIHRLRVAARRLGSALDAFAEHFPAKGAAKVARKASRLRKAAGAVRDLDIALALAAEADIELSEKTLDRVKADRAAAVDKLSSRLARMSRGSPGAQWSRQLRLTGSRRDETGPTAASYAAALLPSLAGEYLGAGRVAADPAATIEQLHEFRILGKRLRYTLELFEPCYGDTLRDALQLLRGVQDTLGMVNDCETSAGLLTGVAGKSQRKDVEETLNRRKAALIENFRSHWNETFASEEEQHAWMQMLAKPAFSPRSESSAAEEEAAAS